MAEFTVGSGLRPEDMLLHDVHQAMTDADRLFQDSCEGLLDDQLVYHADYLREHMPMWESAASTLSFDKASDFYHAGRILGEMQSTYAIANMYPEFLSEKDRNTYQELHQFVLNGNDVLSLDGVVSPDGFSSDTASGRQRISCAVNAGMVEGVLSTAKRNYEYGYEHALDIDIDDRYIYRNEFARSASLVDRANEMVSEALKNGTLFADVRSKDQFSNDVQETMAMLKTVSSNSFFLEHLPRVSGLVTEFVENKGENPTFAPGADYHDGIRERISGIQKYLDTCDFTMFDDFAELGRIQGEFQAELLLDSLSLSESDMSEYYMQAMEAVNACLKLQVMMPSGRKSGFHAELGQIYEVGKLTGMLDRTFAREPDCRSDGRDSENYQNLSALAMYLTDGGRKVAQERRLDAYLAEVQGKQNLLQYDVFFENETGKVLSEVESYAALSFSTAFVPKGAAAVEVIDRQVSQLNLFLSGSSDKPAPCYFTELSSYIEAGRRVGALEETMNRLGVSPEFVSDVREDYRSLFSRTPFFSNGFQNGGPADILGAVTNAYQTGLCMGHLEQAVAYCPDCLSDVGYQKLSDDLGHLLVGAEQYDAVHGISERLEERQAYDIKLSKGKETMRTKKTAAKAKTAEVQKTADELFRDKVYVQDVNTQVDALMKDVFGKSISGSNIDGTYRMKSDFDAKSSLDVHMQELQEFMNTCEFTKLSDFESAGRMYGHVIGDIRIAANHFPDFAEDTECGEVVHCAFCNDMLGGKPAFYELLNDKNGREEMGQAFQTGVIAGKLQSMFNCYSGLSDNDTYNTLFNDMSQLHKGMESVAESNRVDDYLMRTQACSGRPLSHPEMSEGHVGLDADLTVDGALRGTAHIEAMDRNSVKLKWLDISPVKEGGVFGRHLYETSQVYPRNVVSDYDNVRRMTTEEAQNMKTQSVLRNKPVLARYDAYAQAMMQGRMAPAPEAVKPAEKAAEQPKAAEPKEASAEAPKAEAGEKKSAEQKRPSHLIRTNNGMIHSITGYPGRKAVTVGIANGEDKPLIGTVYVGNNSIIPDKKTANLPDANKASFVAFSPTKMYDFVLRTKDAEGNWKNDIRKLTGRSIVEGNRAYMAERQAAKMAAREQDLQANAQAGAEGPQMG